MRVSIVNINLIPEDAIGQSIMNQITYFFKRGDTVNTYVESLPSNLDDQFSRILHARNVTTLMTDTDFLSSDLFIYHYPCYYHLLDSMERIDSGSILLNYHNVTPIESWNHPFISELLRTSRKKISRFAHLADILVCDSPYNAHDLEHEASADPDKIRLLPLAVRVTPRQEGNDSIPQDLKRALDGRKVLLFIGRVAGNKRVDKLVEVLHEVRQELSDAMLLVVGDNNSNPALTDEAHLIRRRAEELDVSDYVWMTGRVPSIAPYLDVSDVYVSASEHEGFGVPIVEAMAAKVPVVATNIESHEWIADDACLLAEPGDVEDFSAKVIQVLTDTGLSNRLVARGSEVASRFSIETYNRNLQKIIVEAVRWLPTTHFPPELKDDSKKSLNSQSTQNEQSPQTEASPSLEYLGSLASLYDRNYEAASNRLIIGGVLQKLRNIVLRQFKQQYVDFAFNRQEAFNTEVIHILRKIENDVSNLTSSSRHLEETLYGTKSAIGDANSRIDDIDNKVAQQLYDHERLAKTLAQYLSLHSREIADLATHNLDFDSK